MFPSASQLIYRTCAILSKKEKTNQRVKTVFRNLVHANKETLREKKRKIFAYKVLPAILHSFLLVVND